MIGLAAILVGLGAALIVVGLLGRLQKKGEDLRELLDLPYGELDVPVPAVTESAGAWRFIRRAGTLLDPLDRRGSVGRSLEAAQIPLRPGEYIFIAATGGTVLSGLLVLFTGNLVLLPFGAMVAVLVAAWVPKRRAERWRRSLEAQLPDALSMIASSLSAGHTFLRSIQNMVEEAEPPLSKEFGRVVSETELGRPVVDALEAVANRTDLRELLWVVQAIRIQQTVGGKLADLLHTLADFMRSRQEVRREVAVLTAEGKMSAIILSCLPFFLFLVLEATSPKYFAPMLQGWHAAIVIATVIWIAVGISVLRRMVRIEV
jgi:tight adherence protein B